MKWSEVKGILSAAEIEYFQEQGLESDKWSEENWSEGEGNLKWGEYQLNVVKGTELRRGGMWSVYKDTEVKCGVGLGDVCNWVLYTTVYSLFSIPNGF